MVKIARVITYALEFIFIRLCPMGWGWERSSQIVLRMYHWDAWRRAHFSYLVLRKSRVACLRNLKLVTFKTCKFNEDTCSSTSNVYAGLCGEFYCNSGLTNGEITWSFNKVCMRSDIHVLYHMLLSCILALYEHNWHEKTYWFPVHLEENCGDHYDLN